MTTIVDVIAAGPGLRPDGGGSCAVLDADGLITAELPWTGVHERARRIATVLADEGIGPGQRIGLLADTSLDLVCTLQAIWLVGAAVTVLPPPTRRTNTLHAIMADADLHAVVADALAIDVLRRAPDPPRLLGLPEVAMLANRAEPAAIHHPDGRDLAVLQYTSGSTRNPRGVPVTHAHLAANIEAINTATVHTDHSGRMLSWLPLFHDMGLIGFLAKPMWCGCSLLLQSPTAFLRRPHSWFEAVSRHRATASGAPNFAYELMTAALTAGLAVDLSEVGILVTGGEPVDAAMMARFTHAAMTRGLDPRAIVPAFGMAESTLAVTFTPARRGVGTDRIDRVVLERDGRAEPRADGTALVTLGPPVPGTSLRILDRITDAELGPRQVGHIEIQGPSVIGHYWGDPPPPPRTWLRTGDLGYLTDAGELVVCGRDKDILFAAGRNIFPQDVEAAANDVPGVRAAGVAAFGLPDPRGDRLIVAVESRATNPDLVRRGVTAAVLAEVGLTPHTVLVLPPGRLPKTSSGKLRRAETRRLYQCGELAEGTTHDHRRPTQPPRHPTL